MKALFFLLLLFSNILYASNPLGIKLSDNAQFGLLTCAPGDELYSTFGHSALRLFDEANDIDIIYNYGMFSFNTDNFYYKFVKGETDYRLGKQTTHSFIREYNWDQRNIYEHKLNLTSIENQQLFDALEINYLPENRVYRYSYLLDNCSSRLRDMLNYILKDKLIWEGNDYDSVISQGYYLYDILDAFTLGNIELTYRDILDMYLIRSPWSDLGIDIVIGAPIDEKADLHGSMFIPDFLMFGVCNSVVERDSGYVPLVKSVELLTEYYHNQIDSIKPKMSHPIYVLWILCFIILAISLWELYKNVHFKSVDFTLFLIYGIFAIIVWFVDHISVHPAVSPNYNNIWLLPTHLFVCIMIFFPSMKKYLLYYFKGIIIISFAFLLFWAIIPQSMNLTNVPIILIPLIRASKYYYNCNYK
jgi:hypothetical protein